METELRPLNKHLPTIRELASQGKDRFYIAEVTGLTVHNITQLSIKHKIDMYDVRRGKFLIRTPQGPKTEFVSPCKIEAERVGYCYTACHQARNGFCEWYKGRKLI